MNTGKFVETLDRLCAVHATLERPLASCRAKAEFLGVSHTQLKRVCDGATPLTVKAARLFSQALGETEEQKEAIFGELSEFVNGGKEVDRGKVAREAFHLQFESVVDFGDML